MFPGLLLGFFLSSLRYISTLITTGAFVNLQEITPNIYEIFQKFNWWKAYSCSVSFEMAMTKRYFCMQMSKLTPKSYCKYPFLNSKMGRELCIAELEIKPDLSLMIATSHLESPCPGPPKWDQMYSNERVQQAKEAMEDLEEYPNAIFCGDMNWEDELDGHFPFPNDGWFDAWEMLRPGENGWTYDTKSNKMLSRNKTLQKRLDRFVCCMKDFEVIGIEMIGLEAIPGLTYLQEKRIKWEVYEFELPVFPSDHYGLILTISLK
ncbi:uncharacterized protein LOC124913209 [Impatiens glandulifera]|uniref:uncharacterized protein LOC124913209 n=1 Tax=Impatiens glandulifera TaxID=253017 RepID=UPI001FB056A2|nr:uncharacterized protein LOC124913209 [Impatiens glandulifera]